MGRLTGAPLDASSPPPDPPRGLAPEAAIVLASMSDAVVTTDDAFRVTSWNRGAAEMYGWTAEEALGQPVGALLRTAWADEAARFESMRGLAQDGGWRGEVVQRRRDGRPLHVLAMVTTLRDEAGRPIGVVAVNRDITAQRQAEEALAQLNERLVEVQLADGLKEMAGSLAHDLNNLFTVIGGYAELAREALPVGHPARRSTEAVVAGIARGEELTEQLLALARQDTAELVPRDLAGEVRGLEPALRGVVGAAHRLELDLQPAWARVSPAELRRVLVNLATNAREALARPGTVRVRVAPEAAGTVVLAVEDDGAGMSREVLLRAVEAFYTTKEPGRGAGLGLSVVSGVVTRWGGQVRLWSEPGRGTRVALVLPAAPPEEARAPAVGAAPGLRILLAEDQEPVREVIGQLLRSLGHQVVAVADGMEAVERAATVGVDLVVTDVSMPRLGGPAAVAVLRAMRPELPVVYLSGFPRDEAGGSGGAWPPGVFRRKPVKREDLATAIAEAMGGARSG